MMPSFCINAALPRLAWIAKVDRSNRTISAMLGRSVECGPDFLVAGVWNGPFKAGDFDATDCFFGTGFVVRENCVIFVPSAAITDAIYYFESASHVVAANSLPLLLAVTQDQLDPHFAFYDRIIESHQAGIHNYERSIPTEKGSVRRVFFKNLSVTAQSVVEIDKRRSPTFPDYGSYLHYVTENYAKIYRNIRDPDRQHPLDIVSTQSRGYDTTAVNSIASQHKIDTVFTIAETVELGGFVGIVPPSRDSDDGSDICEVLGLRATRLDRRLYGRSFEDEYLFYATTNYADSVNLLGIKPHLRRVSVMLTGWRGEIWATDKFYRRTPQLLKGDVVEKNGTNATGAAFISPEMIPDDMRSADMCVLHNLSEVGIDWGLIQLVPALIGGRNRPDIFRVTMSKEMAPWRLGNNYDRPIARRIGEEVGRIPRDLFGQKKMATITKFPLPPVPTGAQLRREYFGFLREHRIAFPLFQLSYRWVHRINARIYHAPYGYYKYVYYARRLLSKLARRDIEIPLAYRRLNGRLYCFCVNKRVKQYKRALHGDECEPRVDGPSARFERATPPVC
jgi:hypothetical protein